MADDDARTGTDQPDTGRADDQPDADRTDDTDWKAEARKWEKRAKENADAARRLAEIEDEKKTEQQKLTEQLEAARAESQRSATAALRLEVALDKAPEGMPLTQVRKLAKRLSGSDRAELESDAEELFADYKPSSNGKRPDLKQGDRGAATSGDPNAWLRRMAGRR